jgi:ferric-dicitrate binding protein FerR (iron transport regulator)
MVDKQDFEALIVRFLEGTATPEEAMLLEDWKNDSGENQEMYEHYGHLFGQGKLSNVDVELAWNKVSGKVSKKTKTIPLKQITYWAAAAAAIVVLAITIPGLMENPIDGKGKITPIVRGEDSNNILTANNGVQSFNLVDNSVVALENGSTLELSKDFSKGTRKAKLKGSGRFTVVHDEAHPFIIDVEGLEVHDVGTIFDISTHNDTVKVIVLEGAVELRKNGQVLAMEEGDSAFYLISQRLIKEYPTPESLKGITISFDGTTLEQVAAHLSAFFKVKLVVVDDAIKKTLVTVNFYDDELPEVLSVLEVIADVKAKRVNNKIEIYEAN